MILHFLIKNLVYSLVNKKISLVKNFEKFLEFNFLKKLSFNTDFFFNFPLMLKITENKNIMYF